MSVAGAFENTRARSATIEAALGRLPRALVSLQLRADSLDPTSLVGKSAQFKATAADGSTQDFVGEVAAAEVQDWSDSGWTVQVQILGGPLAAVLNRHARTYCDMSPAEIVRAVLASHAGFALKADLLKQTYRRRTFTVQYFESDLDFVVRLARDAGFALLFDSGAFPTKYTLLDDGHDFDAAGKVPFSGRTRGANQDLREEILRMRIAASATASTYIVDAHDFRAPRKRLTSDAEGAHGAESGGQRIHLEHTYLEPTEGKLVAEGLALNDAARANSTEAESNSAELTCGRKFQIEEHPDPSMNRIYYITASTSQWTATGEHSSGAAVGGSNCTLRLQYSPRLATRDFDAAAAPSARNLVIGNVTGIEVSGDAPKGSIAVDENGRIRVRFKWHGLSPSAGDTDRTTPIRVSQLWAGEKRGLHLLPRVGDEVLVAFENDDPERPIVVGSLFNENNSPAAIPSEAAQLILRSRSIPNGGASNFNELRFDDSIGKERVSLQAEKDLIEKIKNDVQIEIGNRGQVTAKSAYIIEVGGASLEIKPDSVVLKLGPAHLSFDATGTVVLNGQMIRIG